MREALVEAKPVTAEEVAHRFTRAGKDKVAPIRYSSLDLSPCCSFVAGIPKSFVAICGSMRPETVSLEENGKERMRHGD